VESKIVPATPALLRQVAEDLRPSDRIEVWLSHQHRPQQALEHAAKLSVWTFCVVDDEGPLAAFGLGGRPMSTVCSPWLLGTTRALSAWRAWARFSRPIVQMMTKDVELLENYVHAGNMQSVRWLAQCGFTLDDPKPYGALGAPFHRFWMRGDLCAPPLSV
jgi:hypothetical protein